MIINTDCQYLGREFKKRLDFGQSLVGTLERFAPSYADHFLGNQWKYRYSLTWKEEKTGEFVFQQWFSDDDLQRLLEDPAVTTTSN